MYGAVWNPRKGRYDDVSLRVNLPRKVVEAADGATYEPRFSLNDPADEDRLLMGVVCTLPDVQDPKVEKAHEKVGRFLAKEVRKLQRDLERSGSRTFEANGQAEVRVGALGVATPAVSGPVVGGPVKRRRPGVARTAAS